LGQEKIKNPSHHRKESYNILLDTQIEMDNNQIKTSDIEKEAKLQAEVYREYRKEEEYWRLKSRSMWLKSRDMNTAYFHKQANMRRSHNHIEQLQGTNGIIKGQEQLKEAARNHYKNLFTDEGEEDPSLVEDF